MGPRLKLFLPLFAFAVLAIFLFRGLWLDPAALPSALVGRALPEFSLPGLGESGRRSPADLIGRAGLLNVWATWCPTCQAEHPYLLQLAKQGIPIYGVSYKDDDQAALRWLEELGNPYRFNIADHEGTLGLDLGVYGAPETFLVDAAGIIRYRHVGMVDDKVWRSVLEPLYNKLAAQDNAP
jgi:cytochrome c biogenesis protein CcmG/thiol:disulfide interchange protein DsbE